MKNQSQSDHLSRAVWPEVVFAIDIALVLGLDEHEALDGLHAGRFGPFFEVHGRPAVLRRDLIETLTLRAASPAALKEVMGNGGRVN